MICWQLEVEMLHRPHASENLNLRKKSDIIWFLSRALHHNLPSQPSVVTFHRNGRCTLTLSKFRPSGLRQGLESVLSNCLNNFGHNDESFYLLMICLWFVDSWKSRCLHRPHASENLNLRKKSDIIWFLSRALRHNLPSQPSVVTFHRNGRCTLTLSKFRPSGLSYPTA
jgi:hypothetical protein